MFKPQSVARLGAIGSTLLVMAAASTASAAAKTRTIHLSAITEHADINAGVSSKASLKLETTAGKRAGSATWDCAFASPFSGNPTNACTDTYHLGGGTITVSYSYNADKSGGLGRHSIVAGTGAFAHASGTVTVVARYPVFRVTIRVR